MEKIVKYAEMKDLFEANVITDLHDKVHDYAVVCTSVVICTTCTYVLHVVHVSYRLYQPLCPGVCVCV